MPQEEPQHKDRSCGERAISFAQGSVCAEFRLRLQFESLKDMPAVALAALDCFV
jgi:hypothetical protein